MPLVRPSIYTPLYEKGMKKTENKSMQTTYFCDQGLEIKNLVHDALTSVQHNNNNTFKVNCLTLASNFYLGYQGDRKDAEFQIGVRPSSRGSVINGER